MQFLFIVCLRVLHNNHLIIYPLPKPPPDLSFPYPPNSPSVFVCLVSYLWRHILVDMWSSAGEVHLPGTMLTKKTCSPFPRSYQMPTAPKLVHVQLPSQMVGFDQTWTCIGPVNAVITAMSSLVWWPCHVHMTLSPCVHPHPLVLTVFARTLGHAPEPWEENIWSRCPI